MTARMQNKTFLVSTPHAGCLQLDLCLFGDERAVRGKGAVLPVTAARRGQRVPIADACATLLPRGLPVRPSYTSRKFPLPSRACDGVNPLTEKGRLGWMLGS
jgi:hypothetical protein